MGGQQDLLSDQGAPDGMGRPGGPGSRNTNITYKGATELKAGSTEDSHTYQSSKTDENALLISTKEADGTILVGSDSELTLTLSDGSTFIGCISGNITNAVGNSISTETGKVNVILGGDCTWTLTADTYITSFKGEASHIKTNGHRLFVDGKELKITQ